MVVVSLTAIDSSRQGLFEYFPVCPLVRFPLNLDRLVPAPLVIDEFLVLRFAGIKLGELIALVVGCNVKGRLRFLATDDKGTLDNGVIFDAVNRGAAKDVLAGTLEAGEKSAY